MNKKKTKKPISPVREVRQIIQDSRDPGYVNRLLIGTPTTGSVRMEWVNARYGQTIPTNWSMVQMVQFMNIFMPYRYQVADAQNLIVKEAVEKDFEWLLLIEDDTAPPPDAFIRFNQYMRDGTVPIVSGLYFTRSIPAEPMIYRGRGNSFYTDWKRGDKVWCDGVPTGMLLIHHSILKAVWDESPEYLCGTVKTRRVFNTPRDMWYNETTGSFNTTEGTSDLDWCTKLVRDGFFTKAGWPQYQKKKWPFLVDTNIFCRHIDRGSGIQYPTEF